MKSRKRFITLALLLFLSLSVSCAATAGRNNTIGGTAVGTALGAGLGAIIGNQTGSPGAGVAIGAATGALGGALVGNSLDNEARANSELKNQLAENERQLAENRRLIEELRASGADVRASDRGVVVNLPDILFDFNSDRLTREALQQVDEVAKILKTVPNRMIAVEGHTDSIGSFSYNQDLSERRARSVARELTSVGIPRSQVRAKGYGEGSPIATNNSDAGRARNRRVEVIIEN